MRHLHISELSCGSTCKSICKCKALIASLDAKYCKHDVVYGVACCVVVYIIRKIESIFWTIQVQLLIVLHYLLDRSVHPPKAPEISRKGVCVRVRVCVPIVFSMYTHTYTHTNKHVYQGIFM